MRVSLALVCLLILVSCGGAARRVTYQLDGSAAAAVVSYRDGSGRTVKASAVLPWTISVDLPAGATPFVSATGPAASATLRCVASIDGAPTLTNSASGARAVVVCGS